MCNALEFTFNTITGRLSDSPITGKNKHELTGLLQEELFSIDPGNYDTEEREFIADLFFELSNILGVSNFGEILDNWLYPGILKPPAGNNTKVVTLYTQPCNNCGQPLQTNILESGSNPANAVWVMGMCHNCNSPNLIAPGVSQVAPLNYTLLGSLPVSDYPLEQVTMMLEQLKNMKM